MKKVRCFTVETPFGTFKGTKETLMFISGLLDTLEPLLNCTKNSEITKAIEKTRMIIDDLFI